MTIITNEFGVEINFEAAVNFMDDEIREMLHQEITPCTDQEFFDAYCKSHEDKFDEEWELAKENPVF